MEFVCALICSYRPVCLKCTLHTDSSFSHLLSMLLADELILPPCKHAFHNKGCVDSPGRRKAHTGRFMSCLAGYIPVTIFLLPSPDYISVSHGSSVFSMFVFSHPVNHLCVLRRTCCEVKVNVLSS